MDRDPSAMRRDRYSKRNSALGIALSVLLAPLMYWAYTGLMLDRVERATRQIEDNTHASLERLQANQQRNDRERRERAAQARLGEVAAQRQATAAELQRQQAEQRKEQAWARFYVPPAACDKPPTWEFQVECGNRHMRAKREFEAKWSRGDPGVGALAASNPSLGESS